MNNLPSDPYLSKPLPPPARNEKLPPAPPSDIEHSFSLSAATDIRSLPPTSISTLNIPPSSFDTSLFPSFISSSTYSAPMLGAPSTPTTPLTPSSSQPEGRAKKSNPLVDLIDTERVYVEQLTGIIRKVAAAWSRSNLPPPDLDTMFRSIEGVYKANRGLNSKLKEIGTNPSSPKALGDLLMRWIDDLEGPYTTYCTKFCCGFDDWHPVQSNPRLPDVLANFSATVPPPSSGSTGAPTWSLDALFLLPKARLKYYRKLYSRLLKSTVPGRSDHRLLVGALETLDRLLDTLDNRAVVKVGGSVSSPVIPPMEDEVVIDLRSSGGQSPPQNNSRGSDGSFMPPGNTGSTRDSDTSNRGPLQTAVIPNANRGSSSTLSRPISDLERRLSTQRTLDIFTMTHKDVRLQMSPPSLTFTRELRLSVDVVIRFTPRATGMEVVHRRGHIYLLSDLFLICERISPEDQGQLGVDGADMWLCYPPLSGKVLRVSEVEGQGCITQVAVMRKETLFLEAESPQVRNVMLAEFKECIEFATSLPPPSKQPPPPMPPLPNFAQGPPSHQPPNENRSGMQTGNQPTRIPPSPGFQRQDSNGLPSSRSLPPGPDGRLAEDFSRMVLPPEVQMQQGAHRMPAVHDQNQGPLPGQAYPQSPYNPGVIPGGRSSLGSAPHHEPVRQNSGPGYPVNFAPGPQSHNPGHHGPGHPLSPPRQPPYGLPPGSAPPGPMAHGPRPPSQSSFQNGVRKMPSTRSLASQYDPPGSAPPVPSWPPNNPNGLPHNNSSGTLHAPQPRTILPSAAFNTRAISVAEPSFDEPSPPNSPVEETRIPDGPLTSAISAQMKCKVFLQQQHAQWKSLGAAKLKLYRQDPTNIKQLVVEAENKDKSVLISTIVLTDGVERVGKTGVAIELSDHGARTGIVYMIQLRNEKSAGGLFDSLLAGSDRAN